MKNNFMMSKKDFEKLKVRHVAFEKAYRELVGRSNDALNHAKRAIFAFHRGDIDGAKVILAEALKLISDFETQFKKEPSLRYEGVYRAAVEEFLEAQFLGQFLMKKPLVPPEDLPDIDPELYLGGLSDLTGELVRYAVARATAHDSAEVNRAKQTLDEVMEFLINLDLTGYLRTKYDQAKNSTRRMEEIVYDLSLK